MLGRARRRNSEVSVTGILLLSGGHFLQVLEGHQRVVATMYDRIELDPRHKNVRRLAQLDIPERLFGKWHMGLLNLDERLDLDEGLFARFRERVGFGLSDQNARLQVLELLKEFQCQLDCEPSQESSVATCQ